jgi:hypothetical protein
MLTYKQVPPSPSFSGFSPHPASTHTSKYLGMQVIFRHVRHDHSGIAHQERAPT